MNFTYAERLDLTYNDIDFFIIPCEKTEFLVNDRNTCID